MPRTEDNDFHARLRTLGYGLYLSPDIRAFYAPRQTLRGLWRQYASNGAGIARLLVSNPRGVSVRHLTPAAFVSSLVSLSMAALQSSAARYALEALVSVYVLALIAFSARSWFASPGRHSLLLPLVFVTLHVGYGIGTLRGIASADFARRSLARLATLLEERAWRGRTRTPA